MNGTRNYKVTESKPSSIDVISTLRLKRARKKDLGKYECVVKNSLGESTVSVRLYRKFDFWILKKFIHETLLRLILIALYSENPHVLLIFQMKSFQHPRQEQLLMSRQLGLLLHQVCQLEGKQGLPKM